MNYKDKIISAIAKEACESISGRVIRSLRQMKQGLQSGADSPLENLWDEICVQVKGKPSSMWNYCLETARQLIDGEVSRLSGETRQAIWLQSGAGCEWCKDADNACKLAADCDSAEIDDYILNKFVLPAAKRWNNKRIGKYLEKDL